MKLKVLRIRAVVEENFCYTEKNSAWRAFSKRSEIRTAVICLFAFDCNLSIEPNTVLFWRSDSTQSFNKIKNPIQYHTSLCNIGKYLDQDIFNYCFLP